MAEICWIGGWGVDPAAQERAFATAWPTHRHRVLPPTASALASLPEQGFVGGYSLGARLLLEDAQADRPKLLLAPFTELWSEAGRGGRPPRTAIRLTARQLKREPLEALAQFYALAGLGEAPSTVPYAQEDLLWGLEQILEACPSAALPPDSQALAGTADPLLDADALQTALPDLQLADGLDHHYQALAQAAAERWTL